MSSQSRFHKMDSSGSNYTITHPRLRNPKNTPITPFNSDDVSQVFEFAFDMSFGHNGQHRCHRSGGNLQRQPGQIFANTFQGKLAEYAVADFFNIRFDTKLTPDLTETGLGSWDFSDLVFQNKHISVKSTKSFGNLVLLERKDWSEDAAYIPNVGKGDSHYFATVLVRIFPHSDELLKNERLLYSDTADHDELKNLFMRQSWNYDLTGYLTNEDLYYIINHNFIIPKGSTLNGNASKPMDADNYYIQAGDLRRIELLECEFLPE